MLFIRTSIITIQAMPKIRFNFPKSVKLVLTLAALLITSACQTLDTASSWPDDLPNRSIFVKDFLQKQNVKSVSPSALEEHLIWIVRFYQGTILYPNGWNRASSKFIESVEGERKKRIVAKKMHELGILIVNEWAQENEVRNIDSTNIVTWGSALKTAAERGNQINFLNSVETDVKALISHRIKSSAINYERYYSEEDYDNF